MIHAVDSVTSGEPRASTRQPWVRLENSAHKTMPQTPRRNSQTTPNWAEKNRYAAGAVVALLAAYLVAGRGEPPSSIPPGATLILRPTGSTAVANTTMRRRSCATGASGSWPCGGSARPPPKASNYN